MNLLILFIISRPFTVKFFFEIGILCKHVLNNISHNLAFPSSSTDTQIGEPQINLQFMTGTK